MKLVIEQAHLHAIARAGNHIRDAVPAAVDEKMERSGGRNRCVRRALNVSPPELGGSRLHFAPAPEAAGNLPVDHQKNKTGEHEAHQKEWADATTQITKSGERSNHRSKGIKVNSPCAARQVSRRLFDDP